MTPFRERTEEALLLAFAFVLRWLPLEWARGLAGAVAFLGSQILNIRKGVALDNLTHAFPDMPEREAVRIYRKVWRHFLEVGAEMARLPRLSRASLDRYIDMTSAQVLQDALKQGKGVIFAAGHLGNWEWLGAGASLLGLPITYVVTTQANRRVEEWMDRMRRTAGVEIIPRREAVRGVLSALKRNRVVAMLCDQDAGDAGVFVPFFGRPASTPRGPALFHLKTGAPVVFGAALRKGRRYQAHFENLSLPPSTGDRETDEYALMAAITARLEAEVRRHPDQYLWLHRRWKTKVGSNRE
ncbi:MAG: lysophospholipid acyltransferase family protein [Calditrichaeota bacterium]|nr:lysophospholipid acyltransferase family protein [Calditrichota bacterium]